MPTEVIALRISNGQEINVEVDDVVQVGVKQVGLGPAGEIDFQAVLDVVKGTAAEIHNAITGLAVVPETCEVSFGLKLSASAGVIVAKAGTEANFTIKLQWKK